MNSGPISHLLGRAIRHGRGHVVAYVALSVSLLSLAGASYAALELPAGSVGAMQIRNHSITPVKLSPRSFAGSVRHWATVSETGRVAEASSSAHSKRAGNIVSVNWGDRFSDRCVAVATVHAFGDVSVGSVESSIPPHGSAPTSVAVTGSNAAGQPVAQPFYVAVIC
jgi:hypothetical protein